MEKTKKEIILEAATKLFAQKGFDGARVDDIAQNAGVNKALIYYYFKSKDEILQVLMETFTEELTDMVTSELLSKDILHDYSDADKLFDKFIHFMISRKDIVRVMIIESFKAENEKPPIFSIADIIIQPEVQMMAEQYKDHFPIAEPDTKLIQMIEFFTSQLPSFAALVLQKQWMQTYGLTEQEYFDKLKKMVMMTHMEYHKRQMELFNQQAQREKDQ